MGGKLHDLPGTLAAIVFIVLGAVLVRQTGTMTPMGSVFPIAISCAMMVFAALVIVRNIYLSVRAVPTAPVEDGGSNARRIALVVAMAAWIALIPILGFLTASILGYFAVMVVATHERTSLLQAAILVLVGLAVLVGFYVLMSEVLLIPMPRGLFV